MDIAHKQVDWWNDEQVAAFRAAEPSAQLVQLNGTEVLIGTSLRHGCYTLTVAPTGLSVIVADSVLLDLPTEILHAGSGIFGYLEADFDQRLVCVKACGMSCTTQMGNTAAVILAHTMLAEIVAEAEAEKRTFDA